MDYRQNSLLANELPPKNVFTLTGGHDWVTWKHLWIEVLEYFRVNCSQNGQETCLIDVKRITG